jgi:hypothetical protein
LPEWFPTMKRVTTAKVAVVALAAVLLAGGAAKLYFFTSSPTMTTGLSSNTSDASLSSPFQSAAPPCGYQDSTEQPQGCWADYLGYIPAGYVVAPHYTNGAVYPCPTGIDAGQCRLFQESCGNGVCDPNESCSDCPIDCLPPGQLTCDVYTERADIPSNVCQTIDQYGSLGPG